MNATVFLASKSPQRQQLLEQIGLHYKLLDINVDENVNSTETPQQYVTRLAINKAKAGWLSLQQERIQELQQERKQEIQQGDVKQEVEQGAELPVIGADTCITIDEMILGKPRDRAHGLSMLEMLSGKTHRVYSAVSIIGFAPNNPITESLSNVQDGILDPLLQEWRVNESRVTMRKLSNKETAAYWDTGEPAGKAGGYAVQGLGAQFISHLSGSYSAVMGLPLFELVELLQIFGIRTEVPDA